MKWVCWIFQTGIFKNRWTILVMFTNEFQRAFKALTYPQHVVLSVFLCMWNLIWCEQRKNRRPCNFNVPLSQSKPALNISMCSALKLDFQSTWATQDCSASSPVFKSNWSYLHLRYEFDSSADFTSHPQGKRDTSLLLHFSFQHAVHTCLLRAFSCFCKAWYCVHIVSSVFN